MSSSAAIQFHEPSFRTDQDRLMGRHAATESFFQAWLRDERNAHFVGYVESAPDLQAIKEAVRRVDGHDRRPVTVATPANPRALVETGTLFRPDPRLGDLAFKRRRGDPRRWSLVGITHTTASATAMDAIGSLVTGPVESWDALICTSQAVRRMVQRQIDGQLAYLHERFGITRHVLPALPVIPLGIDVAPFDPDTRQAASHRQRWRRQLGIAPDDVAVLYVGRFSAYVKGHPLPMFVGLEEAIQALAGRLPGRVHLIQAGWFTDDRRRGDWEAAQAALAPSVVHHVLDGRLPDIRAQIRFAADLFCSFADNIQESFGLTPVEAMAAGLPAVVSDWDGYRESVRHGETGLLVPTTAPEPGPGLWLAQRFEDNVDNYDTYCAITAMATAVDVSAARDAFAVLLADPERRRAMGRAGLVRARAFDWPVVLGHYRELFAELGRRRGAARPLQRRAPVHPLKRNPLELFDGYATRTLGSGCRLRATGRMDGHRAVVELACVQIKGRAPGPSERSDALARRIAAAGAGGIGYDDVLQGVQGEAWVAARLDLGWLLKLGLIELVEDAGPSQDDHHPSG